MPATLSEPRLDADAFRYAFRNHPAGVAVITADAGDGPVAMTVSSVASVSIAPPTLVFSASGRSSSTPTLRRADTVVVHLLAADQVHLARLGARSGVERFGADVEWERLPTGEPYYPTANAWLRGRIVERLDVHDSTLVVVEAIEAGGGDGHRPGVAKPLVYHDRTWYALTQAAALPTSAVPFHTVYGRGD